MRDSRHLGRYRRTPWVTVAGFAVAIMDRLPATNSSAEAKPRFLIDGRPLFWFRAFGFVISPAEYIGKPLSGCFLSSDHTAPRTTMQTQPLNPQRLVTILAHLLPPAYPLPPDLLSSALKTRQLYLPPNGRNPQDDRHIAQRPTTADGTDADPEVLSERLSEIAQHLASGHQEFGNEVALQGEGNELEVALYKESSKIRYRALDGETLVASLDLSSPNGGIRILFVAEEGDEDKPEGEGYRAQISMGDEWKLFDVKPLEGEDQLEQWVASPREAFEVVSHEAKEEPEDDYWGGYSDEETSKPQADEARQTAPTIPNPSATVASGTLDAPPVVVTKKVTISPFVSRFNTPLGGPDDAYWSSYGNVEDGLKQSNPSSPRGVARQMTPAGYWGTGGESPVSWYVSPDRRPETLLTAISGLRRLLKHHCRRPHGQQRIQRKSRKTYRTNFRRPRHPPHDGQKTCSSVTRATSIFPRPRSTFHRDRRRLNRWNRRRRR